MKKYDTVIIGAGLAGMSLACQLARANQKVLVVAKGLGALLLSSGAIDVLGFDPPDSLEPVKNPLGQLDAFLAHRPDHPYRFVGRATLEAGLKTFLQLVNNGAAEYQGSPGKNWLLPSAAGAVHPTCLAPTSLVNGDLSQGGRMFIVGFKELRDFYPNLISQNLNAQNLGVESAALIIDAPAPVTGKVNITPIEMARAFEDGNFRHRLVNTLKGKIEKYDRVGFPAVLGLARHTEVLDDLERLLGKRVFEISTLPPSVPGRRLFDALKQTYLQANGTLIVGPEVTDGTIENGRVTQIRFESVNSYKAVRADNFVLATGGTFGGGIETGLGGKVWEPIFGLPVVAETDRHKWYAPEFITPAGQPITYAGVKVNQNLTPADSPAENLYIAGATIVGSNWISGRTGNGVAIATAAMIAKQIGQQAN